MYTYDEHPTKKDATYWKSFSQEKRREEILKIWQTLPENIKACALHIADEEAKFSKKEYMKKQETKNDSEQRKKVHDVTEVEANRLRHLWIDLSLDKKTQCFELYKKNKHPSKADDTIWRSMSPKERREEIFNEWHNLSDSLKICAIHIADYESKLEKEKKKKTPELKELTANDKKINNKKAVKDAVSNDVQNKAEEKPLYLKPHHKIQDKNMNEDSQGPINSNSNQPLHQTVHTSSVSQGNQKKHSAIHIDDYEAKLTEEKKKTTSKLEELTTDDKKIINNKGTKDAITDNVQNQAEVKPINLKNHHQSQENNKNEKKAEEEMKAQEEKHKQVPNKNKNGAVKKDVYEVATKEEIERLRHHWSTSNSHFKTKCYEMYKQDEHPTKQNYKEWKSLDQTERKDEVLEIWPTLSDDTKACVIHIAGKEKKMGEKILK